MNDTNIPMTKQAFYQKSEVPANERAYQSLRNRFGRYFDEVARNSGVENWQIEMLVCVENLQGNTKANSGGTIGLGQILPASIQDIIIMENRDKRLTIGEKSILESQLEGRLNTILNYKKLGSKQIITVSDLENPLFNLQCAAIYLNRLVDECTINRVRRFDQMIVGYNIGYFSSVRKQIKNLSTDAILAKINPDTGNYIKKAVGKYGHAQMILG